MLVSPLCYDSQGYRTERGSKCPLVPEIEMFLYLPMPVLLLQQPRAKCTKGHRQNEPLPPQQQHDGEALALLLSQ